MKIINIKYLQIKYNSKYFWVSFPFLYFSKFRYSNLILQQQSYCLTRRDMTLHEKVVIAFTTMHFFGVNRNRFPFVSSNWGLIESRKQPFSLNYFSAALDNICEISRLKILSLRQTSGILTQEVDTLQGFWFLLLLTFLQWKRLVKYKSLPLITTSALLILWIFARRDFVVGFD